MIRNHSRHGSRFPVTSTSAPGAPTIGTATATGTTTATVSFTQPASDGGSTITSYTATSSPGGITGVLNQAGSGTITVTGLTASTSYTFTVTATNAIGTSAPSAASNSITTYAAITKSLRFRSSASAYLNRTPATATNRTTWTWSAWVKRGTLGATHIGLFSAVSGGETLDICYEGNIGVAADSLRFVYFTGAVLNGNLVTTPLYRDPSGWYHIVAVWDTTDATSTNRMRIFVNGNEVTSFSTSSYPTQNTTALVNNTVAHAVGRYSNTTSYFDGEITEINFVDGQALAPTSFGATGANSQWLPKAYTGTYGTNGFYLPFTNTTSTSTLVADSSGNANNWTPNNISLTAGSTYDSLTDVPTLTSATVANYAVLNPLNVGGSPTLSNGNLTIPWGTSFTGNVLGTIPINSGKWYWEIGFSASLSGCAAGIASSGFSNSTSSPSSAAPPYAHTLTTAGILWDNDSSTNYFTAFTASDILGIKLDYTAGTVFFYKNNTLVTTSNFEASQLWYPIFYKITAVSASQNVNFGQQPFTYTAPTGFLPLNTFNLTAGTVTTSGTFTGNLSTDGPFVFLNGTPTAMTINGNAVTFGTQADKLANGFKVRNSSSSYNASGSNTYTASVVGAVFKYEDAQSNP